MNSKTKCLYEFDDFRVDPNQKCLWRDTELVSLTPKAFDTLVVLLENNGKVVSKEDLLNQVWANTFVEESTLAQNISTLRKIFKDKQFIETIPRRGYRFIGKVHEFFDEEIVVVETLRQTRILAEQEIVNSDSNQRVVEKPLLDSGILRRSEIFAATLVVILISVAVASFLVFRYYFSSVNAFENKFNQFETTKLASSGNIHRLAYSPDGNYLALVEKTGETQTLRIKQTSNPNTIEIVSPTNADIIGITFSPDNQSIFYTVYENNNSGLPSKMGIVYKIPILGGNRSEVIKDVDSSIAFSPIDANKIAFIRNAPQTRESTLMTADIASGTEQKIATRPINNRFFREGISWSPDGKFIVNGVLNSDEKLNSYQLAITDVSNGEQKYLSTVNWAWLGQIEWLKDGSGILLIAYTDKSPNLTDEVWLISYPEGKARQIANGINGLHGFGVSADGKSIVTARVEKASSLLITSLDKSNESVALNKKIGDNSLINLGLETTLDNKIIYSSSQQGNNADIWIVDGDGSNLKQLTIDPAADYFPKISPDGKFIVFISNRSGFANLWKMNTDGSNLKQLTDFQDVSSPSISPDNKWIYFVANKNKITPPLLYKVSIDGGESFQITNFITFSPQISADGKQIACIFPKIESDGKPTSARYLTILSATDGKVIKQFETTVFDAENYSPSWSPDGKSISYLLTQNETSDIWLQPIEGGNPTKITNNQSDRIFRYAWLKNGEKIVIEKGINIKEINLIRESSK